MKKFILFTVSFILFSIATPVKAYDYEVFERGKEYFDTLDTLVLFPEKASEYVLESSIEIFVTDMFHAVAEKQSRNNEALSNMPISLLELEDVLMEENERLDEALLEMEEVMIDYYAILDSVNEGEIENGRDHLMNRVTKLKFLFAEVLGESPFEQGTIYYRLHNTYK